MKIRKTGIDGLIIIEPHVIQDSRGYFFESFNLKKFAEQGMDIPFIQDNQSKSEYGVIRGLHMQKEPYAQAKLVRVLEGSIFDVAVDFREGSPTYLKWFGLEISAENTLQLLVPKGCLHGFSVLSETAVVFYKCDEFYHPEAEEGIGFNDPDLAIDWKIPEASIKVSEKDRHLPFLSDLK